MTKVLIIGGGFAGCSAAHMLKLKYSDWDITLVEKNKFLGAGVRTMWHGGHPHTFGPRHFLTENNEAYEYLDKYCPLRLLNHRLLTYVEQDDAFYNFPMHRDDIPKMPDKLEIEEELKSIKGFLGAKNLEEYWIKSVGNILYKKFIKDYNQKMWLIDDNKKLDTFEWSQKIKLTYVRNENETNEQLPQSSPLKEGPKEAFDDAISAYPHAKNGYDDYFDISTKDIKVLLDCTIDRFDIENKKIFIKDEELTFDIIINTISPDSLLDYCYGELPFIGRDFHKIVLPMKQCFPDNVFFLYYANKEKFTRIVEYKKFTLHESSNTLLGLEIPSLNGKHYPIPIKSEQEKAKKYLNDLPNNVFSIGRAGSYDYNIDIDDCIIQSQEISKFI